MRRPVVLAVLLALGAVIPQSAAARPRALAVEVSSVEAHSASAVVAWRASAPVRVRAEVGIGEFGVWSRRSGPGASGRILVGGLEPDTVYRVRLVAEGGGAKSEGAGTFRTAPIQHWTPATTTPNALFLDWQPFFPRMVFKQCPYLYPASLAAGINVFMGVGCTDSSGQVAALGGRAFSVLDMGSRGVPGRGVVGWHHLDEADLHVGPESLPQLPHSRQTKRVTFLTLTNHFFSGAAPLPWGRGMYPAMISRAEMVGFDHYPLQIWCRHNVLHTVYDAQRELVRLAAGKPTFQWIEAAQMEICLGLEPSPAIVRAETWLAIAGGARGIGWFPDVWRADVAGEIGRLSREIAGLAPALLAPETPASVTSGSPIRVGARRLNDAWYVIAVNPTFERVTTTISVPGLRAPVLWALGEGRRLPVRAGRVRDSFRGLQARIYVATPAIG